MQRLTQLNLVAGMVLLGCGVERTPNGSGGSGGGGTPQGPALTAIDVSPRDVTLYVSSSSTGMQDFTALGHYSDGSTQDLTQLVAWTIEEPSLGAFPSNAHLLTSSLRGGRTTVNATSGTIDGTASVTVIIRDDHVAPGAPSDAAARFGGGSDPSRAPTLVYPAEGVMLPPNLGTMEFQWQTQAGTDLYDLHFSSPYLDLHIYTNTDRYSPTAQEWLWLAETHRGAELTYSVRATALAGGGVGETAVRHARFAGMDVKGGLYYWSATSADTEGIWRFDFGASGAIAEKYLAQTDSGAAQVGHCVACHTISHDGTRMAFTYDGGNGRASVMEVATRSMMIPYTQDLHSNFTAFHPDGTRMVTTSNGVLTLREATTGAQLGDLPTGGQATHPDWSVDGTRVVYVSGQGGDDWSVVHGSLEVIDYNGGVWGTPRTLVAAQTQTENNYYPQFSPDGNWVVFNRAAQGSSYNNPAAEVWVTRADGTGSPIKLSAAHDQPMMTDSWPRWSPFQTIQEGGPLMWVTVSSKRTYGLELAAGTRPQLWMFAFDASRAGGGDGSFPAFWLPFQNMQTNNHIGQWTTRIVPVGRSL
jgi:hypothetical protein